MNTFSGYLVVDFGEVGRRYGGMLIINQFKFHIRNPFYKAYTDETVKNSKFRRIDVFNKIIVT